jgi:hypothetical protein
MGDSPSGSCAPSGRMADALLRLTLQIRRAARLQPRGICRIKGAGMSQQRCAPALLPKTPPELGKLSFGKKLRNPRNPFGGRGDYFSERAELESVPHHVPARPFVLPAKSLANGCGPCLGLCKSRWLSWVGARSESAGTTVHNGSRPQHPPKAPEP